MSDYLIVVVNRASARFFTLQPVEFPELESGPRMRTRKELDNPEITDYPEMVTDSKTGRGAAPRGGSVHGYDDKRDQHLDELRRRFAVKVLNQIRRLAKAEGARTVILAASSRMRRFLNPDIELLERQGIHVQKLSKNMINFTPQKIHTLLAAEGLVPEKKRISA
ncbi:MAG: host attachment protein [Desulfobacterales bacterium]